MPDLPVFDAARFASLSRQDPNAAWNEQGDRVLHVAASRQDSAAITQLLLAGADPNLPNALGRTAFLEFCAQWRNCPRSEQLPMLRLWMAHGADPAAHEHEGFTPWHSLLALHSDEISHWLPETLCTPRHMEAWFAKSPVSDRNREPLWTFLPFSLRRQWEDERACRAWLESIALAAQTPPAPSSSPRRI